MLMAVLTPDDIRTIVMSIHSFIQDPANVIIILILVAIIILILQKR